MNYNISFKALNKCLYVSKVEKVTIDEKKLNNTNVITTDDLVFSLTYLRKNFDIVVNFLNLIILKYGIKTVVVKNTEMDLIYLDILKNFKKIEKIMFTDDVQIGSDIFKKLYEFNNIQKIECYEMSSYLIERFDTNKNIKVLTRHKITKKNYFLINNHLDSYTDMYYKKQLILDVEINNDIINDLDNFFSINTRLKAIRIVKYSNETITTIIDMLVKYNKEDVVIIINEKNNDLDEIFKIITYLKKENKAYLEKNRIQFKLNYSKEYKIKNFFKELNIKLVCTILFIALSLIGIFTALNSYQQYEDEQQIGTQMDDINSILASSSVITLDDNISDMTFISDEDFIIPPKKSTYVSPYYINYSHALNELMDLNPDTVGWLQVNNTKINYPVVRNPESNEYYLNHDFRMNRNSMGWVYMDYRNDPYTLDKNTIIYGHNIITGIMFGTLKYTLNSSWYKNTNNHVITFNTHTGDKQWKIFSLYRVDVTEDYLQTVFEDDNEYQNFLNMISSRSVYDFGTPVSTNDYILTLSSCVGTGQRVVMHAVLLNS